MRTSKLSKEALLVELEEARRLLQDALDDRALVERSLQRSADVQAQLTKQIEDLRDDLRMAEEEVEETWHECETLKEAVRLADRMIAVGTARHRAEREAATFYNEVIQKFSLTQGAVRERITAFFGKPFAVCTKCGAIHSKILKMGDADMDIVLCHDCFEASK